MPLIAGPADEQEEALGPREICELGEICVKMARQLRETSEAAAAIFRSLPAAGALLTSPDAMRWTPGEGVAL